MFNNGKYSAATHLILVGLTFNFNELMHKRVRKDPFGDPDSPGWWRSAD